MKILLSGGGTGGHIYPALALMRRIKTVHPDAEFLYVGTERGLESTIVPKAGVPFRSVDIQGLKRSLSLDNLKTVYLMLTSVQKSKKIVKEFNPDVVIGTGGYVCAPVLYAASRLSIPTVIHEQNSVAGVTNKFLARFVDRIAICFEDVRQDFGKYEKKVVYTGNPRAQEVVDITETANLIEYGLSNDLPTVLVFGGSRGAEKINQSLVEAAARFAGENMQAILITGERHFEKVEKQISSLVPGISNVKVLPYTDNMPALFRKVELVVCRSGATTLTELTALGIPSVLIPSPYVTANHQLRNAESLANNGAAMIIEEADLNGTRLYDTIELLLTNKEKREKMSVRAIELGVPDASDRLFAVMQEIM